MVDVFQSRSVVEMDLNKNKTLKYLVDSFQLSIFGDSLKIIWRFSTSSTTITAVITATTATTSVHSATENFKSFCPGLMSALMVMTE